MSGVDMNRVKKELKDCRKDSSSIEVTVPDEANLLHWKGCIKGPTGTPYEGGIFNIDITIPHDYPFVPPKMKFDTKICHPNISSETGAICLDILKTEWSPALTIRTALISLQALLSAPEPDDPQDGVVASMYKKNITEFNATAKYWTETYAGEQTGEEEKVAKLAEMGFPPEQCRKVLREQGGDENKALDVLLSSM